MKTLLIITGAKYLIIAPIVIALYLLVRLSGAKRRRFILLTVISLPVAYVIAKVTSHFYTDPRPFVVGNFTPLISHAADNGFPSDHALLAGALAVVTYRFGKNAGLISILAALLIGLARVLAGVHHWVDILGSFAIALVAVVIVAKLLDRRFMIRS